MWRLWVPFRRREVYLYPGRGERGEYDKERRLREEDLGWWVGGRRRSG